MKAPQFTFILFIFCISHVQAQLGTINTLTIIPSNPLPSDSIRVVCSSTFSSGGCHLTNFSFTKSENNIMVNARHTIGPLTYICQTTDTITLGMYSPGNYYVIYYLINDYNLAVLDTAFVNFNVQQTTGIDYNKHEVKVRVYPNPFENKTSIFIDNDINSGEISLEIFDLFQRKVGQYKEVVGNVIEINKGNLSKGVYIYKLFNRNKLINAGKLIVQ